MYNEITRCETVLDMHGSSHHFFCNETEIVRKENSKSGKDCIILDCKI